MRIRILGATLLGAFVLASAASADEGLFWVVGGPSKGCQIVQSNPIIIGDLTFADGPYRSKDDAKLAMTTISLCRT